MAKRKALTWSAMEGLRLAKFLPLLKKSHADGQIL